MDTIKINEYDSFFRFIDKYKSSGFKSIDNNDLLMIKLEEMMEKNNQFFYILDFTRLIIVFTSKRCEQMLGLKPEEMDARHIFGKTHPDDHQRHNVSRSKVFQLTNDIFMNPNEDYAIVSSNYRFLNLQGEYRNLLVQGYIFKSEKPEPNIFGILVHTDIEWFGEIKYGSNNYIGKDLNHFRLPDKELILEGCILTEREFQIIKLIKEGLSSKQIGEKIYLSSHTIDTHRRNILKKTKKSNIAELVIDLMERGVI